jgi:hypothetical protein
MDLVLEPCPIRVGRKWPPYGSPWAASYDISCKVLKRRPCDFSGTRLDLIRTNVGFEATRIMRRERTRNRPESEVLTSNVFRRV